MFLAETTLKGKVIVNFTDKTIGLFMLFVSLQDKEQGLLA
jgi:hypothetical protein